MASSLTPLGKFCKWIMIPVALFALGYFVCGPKLGTTPIPKLLNQGSDQTSSAQTPAVTGDASQPNVSVSVQPASGGK